MRTRRASPMRRTRVFMGPGRGHHFETPQRRLHGMRNRGFVALGRYELAVTAFLAEYLPSSGAFFDIGASTGYFTRVALAIMPPTAKIVAFEPDSRAAAELRGGFDDPRLCVRAEAAGRE